MSKAYFVDLQIFESKILCIYFDISEGGLIFKFDVQKPLVPPKPFFVQ